MNEYLTQIREQQKASWNNFSPGWKKWDALTMAFIRPMGDEIIKLLDPKNDQVILDVASGTGEPGLSMATKLNGGKVVLQDLAEDMLEVAKENARQRGINNIETCVCDVCELPFEDNSFDAVSCRFGLMFVPDTQAALNEMSRVLKPGGKIALAVWDVPEKNFWITAMIQSISKHIEITPPPPDAPGIFRCAGEGIVSGWCHKAGFKNITEKEISSKLNTETPENYWSLTTEVSAPIAGILSEADDDVKAKIKNDLLKLLNEKYPEGNVRLDASARIVYGEKGS